MASASAELPSGSPPPSRAATEIARASLVKCWPRRASTTAFLCLIEAHLECPDMTLQSSLDRRFGTRGAGPPPSLATAPGDIGPDERMPPRRSGVRPPPMSTISPGVFKAYDIRGIHGSDLDAA